MPLKHREYAEWTPERITQWAAANGPATAELTRRIIASRDHPQQGYRTCLGIIRLGKSYGPERLEAAAKRALDIGALGYRSIESILKNGLDRQALPSTQMEDSRSVTPVLEHENIRGSIYYTLNPSNGDTQQC
jgi:transposase